MSETNAPVFRRHCCAHRDRPQYVTQSTETKYDEEAETDTQEGVEKRLHADAMNYVDE